MRVTMPGMKTVTLRITLPATMREIEAKAIEAALALHEGKPAQFKLAADTLQVSYSTLYRRRQRMRQVTK